MITGIHKGSTEKFQIGLVPPGAVPIQSGPTVTVDDAEVLVSVVQADLSFTMTVDVAETAEQFNCKIDLVNGAGDPVSAEFVIPIIAAPQPQVTDITLDQIPGVVMNPLRSAKK